MKSVKMAEDTTYLIEIVAKLKDEASAKLALLRAELDRIKGTKDADKATQDLGRSTEDLGRKSEAATQKQRSLREEHEKGTRARKDVGSASENLSSRLEQEKKAADASAAAHERLGVAHSGTAEGISGVERTVRSFNQALEENRGKVDDHGKAFKELEYRASALGVSFDNFDKKVRSGVLSSSETKRGYSDFSRELNKVSRAFDAGSASAERWGVKADEAAKKARSAAYTSTGGFLGSIGRGDAGSALEALSAKFGDFGIRVSGVASNLQGFFTLLKIGLSQQIVTGLVSLAGAFVSVASAATQAGAALAGAFISGVGQAIPMISVALAAAERFKSILQAVSIATQAEQQAFFDPTQKQRTQLQNQSQLISSQQQLSNSYIQLFDAQQRVRLSQIALTEARVDALRNIENLMLAEKQAKLQAEGADLSLSESRRQLQIAIQSGNVAGLQSAELAVKQAELGKQKAVLDVPRAEREARLAQERGVSGTPSVISATAGLTGAKQAVVQAQQAAEAAQRQMKITELQLSTRSSRETSSQAQLKFLESQMSGVEKALFKSLVALEKELKSPNSPLKKITDYIISPFLDATTRIRSLLKDSSFLGPIDELAKAMGAGLSRLEKSTFGAQGTSFFETMAKDAAKNIPIIVSAIEHIMHLFADIAKAAGPAFHRLSEDWNNFWGRLDRSASSESGLKSLTEFFNGSVKYAEDFAKLGKALTELFLALGHDAAPQGLATVNSLTGAIERATSWVQSHGPEVRKFFKETREGLETMGHFLVELGKNLVGAFNLSGLEALGSFLNQILIPALKDVVNTFGFITKVVLEFFNLFGSNGRKALEGIAAFVASLVFIGKLYEPITKVVRVFEALYSSTKALMIGEGIKGAWDALITTFKGVGESAHGAAKSVRELKGAQEGTTAVTIGGTAATGATTAAVGGTAAGVGTEAAAGGGVLGGIGAAASSISAPFVAAAAAVTAAVVGAFIDIKTNFLGIRSLFESWANWIKTTFVGAWKQLEKTIDVVFGSGTVRAAVHAVGVSFEFLWKMLKEISPYILKVVGIAGLGALAIILTPIIILVSSVAGGIWLLTKALSALESGISFLGKVWNIVWGEIKVAFNNVVGFLAERLANLLSAIKVIVEIANINLPVVGHVFGSTLTNVEKSLTTAEHNLNNFGKEITGHTSHVESEVPKIANVFGTTFGKVETTIGSAKTAVRDGMRFIAAQALETLKALNPGGIVSVSHGGPPLAPSLERLLNPKGNAEGDFIPAQSGGVVRRLAEGGKAEVVLTTDPAHASRQRQLLGQYFRAAPHMAEGGKVGGYEFPFHGSVGTGRTDQGVDYSLTPGSPITSIGDAIIKGIIPNWFKGQPFLWYELLGGPDKGKFPYIAEQITRLAKVGAHVKAGQPIAYYASSGTGLEAGWATSSGQTLAAATTGYREGQTTLAGRAFGAFISGLAHGKVIAGGMAQRLQQIIAPHVTGGGAIGSVAQAALDVTTKAANKYLEKYAPSGGEPSGGTIGSSWSGSWVSVMEQIARAKHWSLEAWKKVVNAESGGNPNALNPSSGAYGIGQFLGSTKEAYAKYGATSSNPVKQIEAMAQYISDRYGTPTAAWAHEQAFRWYSDGGRIGNAPWGGRPVPIIAHEGERVMNPSQYREAARLGGLSPEQLDNHMGYTGTPRQGFAGGGWPEGGLSRYIHPLGGSSSSAITILSEYEITLSNIMNIFGKIKDHFGRLGKHSSGLAKLIEEITVQTSGILDRLQVGREYLKARLSRKAVSSEYTRKGGQVQLGPGGQVGIDTQNVAILAEESKYLEYEQKIVSATMAKVRKEKPSAARTNALNKLLIKQKELGETISQNTEARYQAETQKLQDELTKVNASYQLTSAELSSEVSGFQARGEFGQIGAVDQKTKQAAESQLGVLQQKLEQAKSIGNTEMANQISQEMVGLKQTITNAVIEQITSAQQSIQQASNLAESRTSMLQSLSKTAAGRGNYLEAGSLEKQGLENRGSNLISTRAADEQLLARATQEKDTGAVIQLTEELNKNSAEIAENNLALQNNITVTRELTLGQLEREGSLRGGIFKAGIQGLETIGKTTGFVDIKSMRGLAEGERTSLGIERSGLEGEAGQIGLGVQGMSPSQVLAYLATPQAQATISQIEKYGTQIEKEHLEKVVTGLEQNSLASLSNTEELAKLNGQLNQPQTWSTQSWQQMRGAFFNGMGGMLPQYVAALPPGMRLEGMPNYGGFGPGAPVKSPTIGTLNLTHPVEVLDPQLLGEHLQYHISVAAPVQ